MAMNVQDLIGKVKSLFAKSPTAATGGAGLAQVIGPIVGLIVLTAVAFYAINQVRVGGPVYNQIKTVDDLRADMLPPPLFIVQPYALTNEMYLSLASGDMARSTALEQELAREEKQFNDSVMRWDSTALPKDLHGSYTAVVASGKNFFNIYESQFKPAFKSGSAETTLAALGELRKAYKVNSELVVSFVIGLEKNSKQTALDTSKLLQYALIGLGLLAAAIAAAIYVYGKRQAQATNSAMKLLEEDGQNNQLAVLDLLDEMGDLADGDLTVRAQVKENITGAIADSINYTIDSLRDVVTEINRASEQVNTATSDAQGTSVALLEAAEMQSAANY